MSQRETIRRRRALSGIVAGALVFLGLVGSARSRADEPSEEPQPEVRPGAVVVEHGGHEHLEPDPSAPRWLYFQDGKRLQSFIKHFIESYGERHPTEATGLGLHDRDGKLEVRSRAANQNWERELDAYEDALTSVRADYMSPDDRLDMRILRYFIARERFELLQMKEWERNPIYYNNLLAGSVYELATKEFAPIEERLRHIIDRQRQFPELIASARENLTNPPRLLTEQAIELTNGTVEFLEKELPLVTEGVGDAGLLAEFDRSNAEAAEAVRGYVAFLRDDLLPRSNGEVALGAELFDRMLESWGYVGLDTERLLAIADDELERKERDFKSALDRAPHGEEPAPSGEELLPRTEQTLRAIRRFLADNEIVSLPESDDCRVVAMPGFMYGVAALSPSGPFETETAGAEYLVKLADPEWDDARTAEHLALFNPWQLAIISIHEAYPGHYLQTLARRKLDSPIRKMAGDYALTEGWAHYCEEMMLDAGFGSDDPRYRAAEARASLLRLCRLIASIRMHTEAMTLEDAAKLFEKKAHLDPFPAMQEARRGAFDPGYLNYALGKLAIRKLREEWKAKEGDAYSPRRFHDAVLSYGSIPIAMIRHEMLGASSGPVL